MRRLTAARPPVLIGGLPVVWIAHVMVGSTVAILHCQKGWLGGEVAGAATIRLVLVGLSLVVAGYALSVVFILRRRAAADPEDEFPAFVGTLLASIVVVYLLWANVVQWAGGPCA